VGIIYAHLLCMAQYTIRGTEDTVVNWSLLIVECSAFSC
jgi:hypothetical protein